MHICFPFPRWGFLLCKSPAPGRRPRGPRRWRLLCVPPTPGGRVRPSGSIAHGAESSRPWRPQPPSRPRSPEQHLHAGQPRLRLASTFGPAQYNPAAPRGGGAWAQTERGGERGGPGGRSSGAGAHQAGATRRRGSRLFVLGPPGPAHRLPPMGSVRAAAVRACARECACPRVRPPGRGPCALELTEANWASGHGRGAPVGTPGGVGARGLLQLHAVCWLLWGLKRCCFPMPTPLVAAGAVGEQRRTLRTHSAVTARRSRMVCPSWDFILRTACVLFPSLMNKLVDLKLVTLSEMTLTCSHVGLRFSFVFLCLFLYVAGGPCEERRVPCARAVRFCLRGSHPREGGSGGRGRAQSSSGTFAAVSVAAATDGGETGPSLRGGTSGPDAQVAWMLPGGAPAPRGRISNPLPFHAEVSSFSGLCCK